MCEHPFIFLRTRTNLKVAYEHDLWYSTFWFNFYLKLYRNERNLLNSEGYKFFYCLHFPLRNASVCYQRRLMNKPLKRCSDNRPWCFKPDPPTVSHWQSLSYLASALQCDQLLLRSNTCTDIFCPVTVSHVIALFAWVFCVKTLSSHPTLAFRWGGKTTNNKAKVWLKVFTMSAWLPSLKSKYQNQEKTELSLSFGSKLLSNASLSPLLFLLS
jgi:hypothetical protein